MIHNPSFLDNRNITEISRRGIQYLQTYTYIYTYIYSQRKVEWIMSFIIITKRIPEPS